MRTKAFWPAVLSLALACGDGGTGPSIPTVGTIGPIPDGLTGKVAFVISGVVTSSGGSHVESKVHMIDMASPADRVIYTAPPNFSIQGLTWAPSAQNVVVQTTLFQVDPDGHNTSIWQFHSVTTAGADTPSATAAPDHCSIRPTVRIVDSRTSVVSATIRPPASLSTAAQSIRFRFLAPAISPGGRT
jgi:hypothetical protein